MKKPPPKSWNVTVYFAGQPEQWFRILAPEYVQSSKSFLAFYEEIKKIADWIKEEEK